MSIGAFRACPDHKDYRTGVCLPCEITRLNTEITRLNTELAAARFAEREWHDKANDLLAERER